MKIYAKIDIDNRLVPAFNIDHDNLKKIRKNVVLCIDIKQPRNYEFLKKFFALINMVYDNQERYSNIDHLRHDLTIEAGYFEIRHNLHGVEIYEPKSISFASMDENEFSEFYNAVLDTIVKHFNFDKEDIINNIEQYF